ncbi:hypothetical protein ACJX0J_030299 [Zea mays]
MPYNDVLVYGVRMVNIMVQQDRKQKPNQGAGTWRGSASLEDNRSDAKGQQPKVWHSIIFHIAKEGDPLSSILFNLIADMLALLTERAKKMDKLIKGVVPHLVDNGLSNLQYADDIILFMDHNVDLAKKMKP